MIEDMAGQARTLDAVHRYLLAEGSALLGRGEPVTSVSVREWQRVFIADVCVADSVERVVVKSVAECQLSDPDGLRRVQTHGRTVTARAPARLIPILGARADEGWIVMPWVDGSVLESLAQAELAASPEGTGRVGPALARVATLIATLHQVDGRVLGDSTRATPNTDYLRAMRDAWSHPLARFAVAGRSRPAALFRRACSREFRAGVGDRLVPVDVQPKNIVLGADDTPTMIDPDYVCGNPALTLVNMLLSLDLLTLRHPSRAAAARISQWKRTFLDAYRAAGGGSCIADVPAMYAWRLVRSYQQHAKARRWAAPHLAQNYARMLRRFVNDWLSPESMLTPRYDAADHERPLQRAA